MHGFLDIPVCWERAVYALNIKNITDDATSREQVKTSWLQKMRRRSLATKVNALVENCKCRNEVANTRRPSTNLRHGCKPYNFRCITQKGRRYIEKTHINRSLLIFHGRLGGNWGPPLSWSLIFAYAPIQRIWLVCWWLVDDLWSQIFFLGRKTNLNTMLSLNRIYHQSIFMINSAKVSLLWL